MAEASDPIECPQGHVGLASAAVDVRVGGWCLPGARPVVGAAPLGWRLLRRHVRLLIAPGSRSAPELLDDPSSRSRRRGPAPSNSMRWYSRAGPMAREQLDVAVGRQLPGLHRPTHPPPSSLAAGRVHQPGPETRFLGQLRVTCDVGGQRGGQLLSMPGSSCAMAPASWPCRRGCHRCRRGGPRPGGQVLQGVEAPSRDLVRPPPVDRVPADPRRHGRRPRS